MHSKLGLLTLVVCASLFSAAHAQTGTVTFQGAVTASACTVGVNGGGAGTVIMPGEDVATLPNVGSVSGWTPFTINVKNCNNTVTKVWVHFYGGNTNANTRLNNQVVPGAATGVDVQLTRDNGFSIAAGMAPSIVTGSNPTLVGGAADLNYGVQYYRTGPITPGSVKATVNFELQFN